MTTRNWIGIMFITILYHQTGLPSTHHAIYNTIKECNSITDVLQYASIENILMIFDIDNTLAMPVTDVGSSQWFSYRINNIMSTGLNRIQALEIVLPVYFKIQNIIDLKPVENDLTINVMQQLKDLNVSTMALTSRSYHIATRTSDQLANAGIQLNIPPCLNHPWEFTMQSRIVFQNGILFCGHNNKGQALMNLCGACSFKPACVLFVNDKINYLEAVGSACCEKGISFIGLRYNYLDSYGTPYDPIKTEAETRSLLKRYMIEDIMF